jgi:hypothetical protein
VTPTMTSSPGEALRAGLRVWVLGFSFGVLGFRPRRRYQRSKDCCSTPSLTHPLSLCVFFSLPASLSITLSLSLSSSSLPGALSL